MGKMWRGEHGGIKDFWIIFLIFAIMFKNVTSLLTQNDDADFASKLKTLKSNAITDVRDFYHVEDAFEDLQAHRRVRRQTGNGLMTPADQQLILQKHNERRRNEVRAEGVSNMELMVSIIL